MLSRCHLEAEKARMRAETAYSPEHKRDLQFMELRWLMLARKYQDAKGPGGTYQGPLASA
jgi:hypothetical protein